MKYISFGIPCYNSEDYLEKCVNSLLIGKDDVEIIIVNDGSSDNTLKIANDYKKKYPNIIKVIDKENGGHGSGVNASLEVATGLFFKVVDSDDWVDSDSLFKILDTIKYFHKNNISVDMLISDFAVERNGSAKYLRYNELPKNKVFDWNGFKNFKMTSFLVMHSICYNTEFLKSTKVKLPEHTFYVDNIFVYYPLAFVKNIYYLPVPFYRYFIGRDDQSVNRNVIVKRIDQYIFVTKTMIDFFDPYDLDNKYLTKYLLNYLDIIIANCILLTQMCNDKKDRDKKKDILNYLKKNKNIYNYCKFRVTGLARIHRFISLPFYEIVKKIYKID